MMKGVITSLFNLITFCFFVRIELFLRREDKVMIKSRMIIEYSVNIFDFNVDYIKVKVEYVTLNFNTFLKYF